MLASILVVADDLLHLNFEKIKKSRMAKQVFYRGTLSVSLLTLYIHPAQWHYRKEVKK